VQAAPPSGRRRRFERRGPDAGVESERVRSRLVAILATPALVLGGCGGSSSSEGPNAKRLSADARSVAQVVDDLASLGRSGKAGEVCKRLFSSGFVARLTAASPRPCATQVKTRFGRPNQSFTIVRLVIRAPRASALATEQTGKSAELFFVKQAGSWRIDSISATP